jgi:hypothetical protein
MLGLIVAGIGLLGFLGGCGSVLQEQKKESPTAPPVAPVVMKQERPQGSYYDFEDIQIPNELKVDTKNTKIFQTTNVVAGVLALDGYVEMKSLLTFFKEGMAKDNWQLKGNFKLPPKTILLFEKKNKRSVFFIEETMFNTRLEIWLIPTTDG